jgi:DNA-binding NarL/FixJ family response regulator
MEKLKILIADDHPLLRDGLVQLLMKEPDFEVVGQAADGEEAVRLASEKVPDVVVMDIEMPRLDGLEATRQVRAAHPETSVLVLTVHDDEEYISALLDAGAAGYLLKTTYGKELVQAIRAVRVGEFVLDTKIGPKVFRAYATKSSKPAAPKDGEKLSERELEVMRLVGQGMTNEEISREMGVGSRIEVITSCLQNGILSLDDISQR